MSVSSVVAQAPRSDEYWATVGGARVPILREFEQQAKKLDRDRNRELTLQEFAQATRHLRGNLVVDKDDFAQGLLHQFTGTPSIYQSAYPSLESLELQLTSLAQDFPDAVATETLTKSTEGRPVRLFKLHHPDHPRAQQRVLVVAAQHAREWVTPLVASQLMESLLKENRQVLAGMDVWVIPIANPDGYRYSHQMDPMWRKNRTPWDGAHGVDLNRNYPHEYRPPGDRQDRLKDDSGASDDPNSLQYRGPAPLSEQETHAIDSLLKSEGLLAVFDLHGFGCKIVLPNAASRTVPAARYSSLAGTLQEALGEPYESVEFDDLYEISGNLAAQADSLGVSGVTLEIGRAFQPHPSKLKPLTWLVTQALIRAIGEMKSEPLVRRASHGDDPE